MTADMGRRIRATREAAGWTIGRLAKAARIDAAVLEAFERGDEVSISTAAITRAARALGIPVSEWTSVEPTKASAAVYFRHTSVPDFYDADRVLVVAALAEAAVCHELRTILGAQCHPFSSERRVRSAPYQDGYRLARAVRMWMKNYDQPIEDVRSVLEDRFGVPVVHASLRTPSVAAFTVKQREPSMAAVVVNSRVPRSKGLAYERIDLAHELAHVLFDEPQGEFSLWIDLETDPSTPSPIEQRAKAFAAEFLAPERGLKRSIGMPHGSWSTSECVAGGQRVMDEFGLTPEVTANHLHNRGYVPEAHRTWLAGRLVRPTQPAVGRARLVERLAVAAVQRELISPMRARELLELSPWDELPDVGESSHVPP